MELQDNLLFFAPGGEIIENKTRFHKTLEHAKSFDAPPIPLWTNVRRIHDAETWTLMDSIGNEQFGKQDNEAYFETESYDFEEAVLFLWNLPAIALKENARFEPEDCANGPGDIIWKVIDVNESVIPSPRTVLCWQPEDQKNPPVDRHTFVHSCFSS